MSQPKKKLCLENFPLFGIICPFVLCSCLYADPLISADIGDFVFKYETSEKIRNIKVYYYAPEKLMPSSRIVFVLHSDNRNGRAYRDEWKQYAVKNNFLVLCPEFPEKDFPFWEYNCGNVYNNEKKSFKPRELWTFNIIEKLFDLVKNDRQMRADYYCIFGHSSGAQFVQRMVLFMPEARFSMAIADGVGWFTMPNFDNDFILGIRNSPLTEETLKKAFGKQLIILMGEDDKVSKKMPPSYSQTTHKWDRLWRAKFFYKEAKAKSQMLGTEFNWLFRIVPGADHIDPKHALWASRYVVKSPKFMNDAGSKIQEQ
jgi:hypothetical protein